MNKSDKRALSYLIVTGGLTLSYFFLRSSSWQGSAQLHTLMECIATLLAFMVGSMALVRYYSRQDDNFLIIGTCFLGTGFLDGYHALVTSTWFKDYLPSDLPALIPWSWVASRFFLAIVLFYSWWAWYKKHKSKNYQLLSPTLVYQCTAFFTLFSFLFFVFSPLPPAYYPELVFHRPEEFIPALFFALALIGYVNKGAWKDNSFEHCLVLALIVNLVSQAVFMSFSGHLFDLEFDAAHLLKKVSYLCVLVGLFINMYESFKQVEKEIEEKELAQVALANSEVRYRSVIDSVMDGILTIDTKGRVMTMNPAAETIFGYHKIEIIGNNVKTLMPEPYHGQHDGYLYNYLTTGVAQIIGKGREVQGKRKNGDIFPMELAISEATINERRMFIGLVRDITERKKIEKMKNEFISTVSHELRTPLTSIQGALELILSGTMGELSDDCKPLLEIANNNSSRLVRLINDILDIEKIESGKMEFALKPLDIVDVVKHSVDVKNAYANEYGVTLTMFEQLDHCYVLADSDRLIQVLTNLISNAVKFSPKGISIEISVATQGDNNVRVGVTDYGSGIPDDFKKNIFSKFSQADASSTKQQGGTGLGLSISKAIIEKMGGQINYSSVLNRKTCFYFDLPIYQQIIDSNPDTDTDTDTDTILICEDDPDISHLLKLMLEQKGFSADITSSAEQAKEKLLKKHYVAMTLDLKLPGQSGIEFFKELRQTKGISEIPVIVISATIDKGKAELNGKAISVYDWLNKPIDPARLELAVNKAIKSKVKNHFQILHVEDDLDTVILVQRLLKNKATVDVAMDLKTAEKKLQQNYDLIILDLALPDGSGRTLLPMLAERMPPIPVVVFSAQDNLEELKDCVSIHLVKSKTSNEDLISSIELILKQKTRQISR